ncbi:hypothetical protein [Streptomyces sp. NPDC048172]|uniref:hypothetical protein n=1 Tax=Streptomyces sp. NPDC048172 TaxID=3365505 RepID=UPI0037165675
MTTQAPPPATRKRGRETSRSFATTGLIAFGVTAVTVPLGLLDGLPFVGELLSGKGAMGTIAFLVMTLALWVVLFVLQRLRQAAREQAATAKVREKLAERPAARTPGALARAVLSTLDAQGRETVIGRRLTALLQGGDPGPGEAQGALAARSELDHARSDVSYGPARALVWALPALGFTGTAAEMAHAVDGLSTSVGGTGGYAELRDALVKDVIPPLADAFGVTLFALSASVVCHVLLTWTHAREERVLLETEEATLELLTASTGGGAGTAAASMLNGELSGLQQELSRTRDTVQTSAQLLSALDLTPLNHLPRLDQLGRLEQLGQLDGLAQLGQLGQLAPLLQSVDGRLERIQAEMRQDLLVTRRPVPTPPPSAPRPFRGDGA